MRNNDRILRCIYTSRLPDFRSSNPITGYLTQNQYRLEEVFNRQLVKQRYIEVYPDNYNIDEVDLIVEKMCNDIHKDYNEKNSVYLFPYIGKQLLILEDGAISVDYTHYLEWEGFISKVEKNVFIAAFLAEKEQKHLVNKIYNNELKHNNNILNSILSENKVSENHMHLKGSANTSEMSWLNFINHGMSDIFRSESAIYKFFYNENNFIDLKSNNHDMEQVKLTCLKGIVMRDLLSQYIIRNKETNNGSLKGNIQDSKTARELDDLHSLLRENDLTNFLGRLTEIDYSNNKLIQKNSNHQYDLIKQSKKEMELLYDAFDILLNQRETFGFYKSFLELLNNYISIMSIFKLQLYQDNKGMGFSRFKTFENVKDDLVDDNDAIYESVFRRYYNEGNIKFIEFRVAPKDKAAMLKLTKKLNKINKAIFKEISDTKPWIKQIEYGLVIHFIKDHSLKKERGYLLRYQFLRNSITKSANYISMILSTYSSINSYNDMDLIKIVGIDTANYELYNPPEVFGLIYRELRAMTRGYMKLGFTYHVGEDFNHITTGLRNIDEVLIFLDYRDGDRIGHGLAMGLDIDFYYKTKRYEMSIRVQDYLDDLVWMYKILNEHKNYEAEMVFVENLFKYILSKYFYFDGALNENIIDYRDSHYLRSDNPNLYTKSDGKVSHKIPLNQSEVASHIEGYQEIVKNNRVLDIHYKYLYDSRYRKAGEEVYKTKVSQKFIEIVKTVQYLLHEKIASKGVYVEVNPSSNRKISNVKHYIDVPFLQFNSHGLTFDRKGKRNLNISINTDDSGIFQTNLNNEYSFIAKALSKEGYDEFEINDYISNLSKASHRHSFVNQLTQGRSVEE